MPTVPVAIRDPGQGWLNKARAYGWNLLTRITEVPMGRNMLANRTE